MSEADLWHDIVIRLANSEVYHSDADGFTFCGVCGSIEMLQGMIHEDDCAYEAALLVQLREAEAKQ